jgi:hypothetical protein
VPARGKVCVKTGLQIAIPSGTYARIAPRSGLAAKHFIDTGAGVVDEDYRGEVLVLLFNHSETDFPSEPLDHTYDQPVLQHKHGMLRRLLHSTLTPSSHPTRHSVRTPRVLSTWAYTQHAAVLHSSCLSRQPAHK